MGTSQQKTIIDPNLTISKQPPANQNIIRQAFRNISINGIINKDKFNQALAILEGMGFKRLRDTPLADRLFDIFDKGKSGRALQKQLIDGINEILKDKNNGIVYSFRIYDSDNDNKINKKQFVNFIEESWIAAFRILGEGIDVNSKISIRDIQLWSKSKISLLNEQSSKIFNRYDINNRGYLEFPQFKDFVTNSQINNITAQFNNIKVNVPLNLVDKLIN